MSVLLSEQQLTFEACVLSGTPSESHMVTHGLHTESCPSNDALLCCSLHVVETLSQGYLLVSCHSGADDVSGDASAPVTKKDPEEKFEATNVSEKHGSIKVKFKRLKKADS